MKIQERKGVCFVGFVVLFAMLAISVQSRMEEEPLLAYLVESGLINLEMVYTFLLLNEFNLRSINISNFFTFM